MAGVPASSHGTTFNGGTITGALGIATGADVSALNIVAPAGMNNNVLQAQVGAGGEFSVFLDTTVAQVAVDDGSGAHGGGLVFADATGGTLTLTSATGNNTNLDVRGTSDRLAVTTGGGVAQPLTIDANGYLLIATHSAPADGALVAGECALWFDQTNGVGNTKLMVKGKSADGTVKTAAIVLT